MFMFKCILSSVFVSFTLASNVTPDLPIANSVQTEAENFLQNSGLAPFFADLPKLPSMPTLPSWSGMSVEALAKQFLGTMMGAANSAVQNIENMNEQEKFTDENVQRYNTMTRQSIGTLEKTVTVVDSSLETVKNSFFLPPNLHVTLSEKAYIGVFHVVSVPYKLNHKVMNFTLHENSTISRGTIKNLLKNHESLVVIYDGLLKRNSAILDKLPADDTVHRKSFEGVRDGVVKLFKESLEQFKVEDPTQKLSKRSKDKIAARIQKSLESVEKKPAETVTEPEETVEEV